jgi:hypothetical protein
VNAWTSFADSSDKVGTPGFRVNDISFGCLKLKPYSASNTSVYFPDMLSSKLDDNAKFLSPISQVLDGTAQITSKTLVYRIEDQAILGKGKVYRVMVVLDEDEDDTKNYYTTKRNDNDEETHNIKRVWAFNDTYINDDDSRSTYRVIITAWHKECVAFGIDPHYAYWYHIILHNQRIHCTILAEYNKKRTLAVEANSIHVLNSNNVNDEDRNDGTYHLRVKSIFVDWLSYLPNHSIPLTVDNVMTIFTDANDENDNDALFFKVTRGGHEKINFKSVYGEGVRNPLHVDGSRLSKILCLGSGARPTINLEDAGHVLNHPGAKFYAIASKDVTGPDHFLELVKTPQFQYQIFLIQNRDEKDKIQ